METAILTQAEIFANLTPAQVMELTTSEFAQYMDWKEAEKKRLAENEKALSAIMKQREKEVKAAKEKAAEKEKFNKMAEKAERVIKAAQKGNARVAIRGIATKEDGKDDWFGEIPEFLQHQLIQGLSNWLEAEYQRLYQLEEPKEQEASEKEIAA